MYFARLLHGWYYIFLSGGTLMTSCLFVMLAAIDDQSLDSLIHEGFLLNLWGMFLWREMTPSGIWLLWGTVYIRNLCFFICWLPGIFRSRILSLLVCLLVFIISMKSLIEAYLVCSIYFNYFLTGSQIAPSLARESQFILSSESFWHDSVSL